MHCGMCKESKTAATVQEEQGNRKFDKPKPVLKRWLHYFHVHLCCPVQRSDGGFVQWSKAITHTLIVVICQRHLLLHLL